MDGPASEINSARGWWEVWGREKILLTGHRKWTAFSTRAALELGAGWSTAWCVPLKHH